MQTIEFRAMGSAMQAVLDSDDPGAAAHLARVPGWFAAWEACLSRFRPDSELSLLNRSAERPVPVGPVLWAVIQAALRAAHRTSGLVTPTLLATLEAAGYDRTFEELPADSVQRPLPPAAPDGWRRIALGTAQRTVRLPVGVRLDLGGIAKGWAADRAARCLGIRGPALIDAGGDIAVSGPRADSSPWPVAVADPRDPEGDLDMLALRRGGVATSGRDYRRWRQAGTEQHHILDPRTGRPAVTEVLSATVVAPTAEAAETAAKAALILGSCDGLAWLDARPSLAGLLFLDDGRVVYSRLMPRYRWS